MKVGAENRTKVVVAIVLFGFAIYLVVRTFGGGGTPAAASSARPQSAPAAAAPTAPVHGRRGGARASTPKTAAQSTTSTASLDPRLRLDLLKASEDTEYKGTGRNIFRAENEAPPIPKPIVNPIKSANVAQPPPGPPPPPPILLKFVGAVSQPGERKKVILSQGDDVFVAGEGDIVNRRYKVLRIDSNAVEIEDLLTNNRQTIPLTQG